ncbi:MAG TPA: cytochrome P450 [Mycobacterium sp.]|nr:cytochrome P450 [Mycobacterium sp.]
MTSTLDSPSSPRFRFIHKIGAWYDAEAYFRRRAKSGRVFEMPIPGFGDVLFAAKPAHIREFLKIPVSAFTPPTPNPVEPVVGDGSIILLDGVRHKHERARFLLALHHERVRRYTGVMVEAALDEIAKWQPGMTIDTRDAAQSITLQIIVQAVFGIDDRNLRDRYVTVVKAMMRDYVAPFMFFPALRRAPFGLGPWQRFSARRVELDAMLSEQVSQRIRTGADGRDDVLSVLMSDDDGAGRSDDDVRQQLRTLLVSGHETSATTLAWALYHVHADEKVRQKLLAELADDPTPEQLPKLPYLAAVIAETLRLHPTVSIVVRQLTCPVTTWQTERAPGDVIGVALPALHADPQIWPDPSAFDPERFLDRRPSPTEYSPFGYGHRRCPGSSFTAQELATALGTILTHVELRIPTGRRRARLPRSIPRGVAAVPSRPIRLEVVRKLPGGNS